MSRHWHRWCLELLLLFSVTLLFPPHSARAAAPKDKPKAPAVRWDEQSPGCTFSRTDDGKHRYGMWSGDVGVVMAVDSQELEKVYRRHEPFFAVLLTVRYRGQESLEVPTDNISLEFVNHFHVLKNRLDPDGFAQKVQKDADSLNDQTARWVEKHPDRKEEKEELVRAFLKDSAELQEFLGKNSLRATQLNPSIAETSGWVLFSPDSKWINGWKKQEEFIVRVPLGGKVFEFPFKLPPKPGEVLLRKRE